MAARRMFSLEILESDKFLNLPMSAQVLYVNLSMRADDDGFVNNPNTIARMVSSKKSDYETLVETGFIIHFESGICVIKHWRIHNYIRKDRYTESIHIKEKQQLCLNSINEYGIINSEGFENAIPLIDACEKAGSHLVDKRSTQDRIGKDSIDKFSLDKYSIDKDSVNDFIENTNIVDKNVENTVENNNTVDNFVESSVESNITVDNSVENTVDRCIVEEIDDEFFIVDTDDKKDIYDVSIFDEVDEDFIDVNIYDNDKIDYKKVVTVFNNTCRSLPKIKILSKKQRRNIDNLIKYLGDMNISEFFKRVEASNFLTKKCKSWNCGFDWVINPINAIKIVCGAYD